MTQTLDRTLTIYGEIATSLRHYSKLILTTRLAIIVQGFLILGAALFSLEKDQHLLALGIEIFGILFSWILNGILSNYTKYFETTSVCLRKFEREHELSDYFQTIENDRDERLKRKRKTVVYGPVLLIIAASSLLILFTIIDKLFPQFLWGVS